MNAWLISDIHVESLRGWDLPSGSKRPDFDVLIVAGDLHTRFERGVAWLRDRVPDKQVIYIAGNHEYWGSDIDVTVEKARRAAAGTNIHVLECDTILLGNVTFIGATGWTDFNLFGSPLAAMKAAAEIMCDYRRIRKRFYAERLRPFDTLRRHEATKRFIATELAKPRTGPRVIVTHHCPFPDVNANRSNIIEAAYSSDMTDLMLPATDAPSGRVLEPADVWAFGHTHRSCDRMIGATRVLSNPKGYGPYMPRYPGWENRNFDPILTIEI
jgi:predicted phosphodiesterase